MGWNFLNYFQPLQLWSLMIIDNFLIIFLSCSCSANCLVLNISIIGNLSASSFRSYMGCHPWPSLGCVITLSHKILTLSKSLAKVSSASVESGLFPALCSKSSSFSFSRPTSLVSKLWKAQVCFQRQGRGGEAWITGSFSPKRGPEIIVTTNTIPATKACLFLAVEPFTKMKRDDSTPF